MRLNKTRTYLGIGILSLLPTWVLSQTQLLPLNSDYHQLEKKLILKASSFHRSIKPFTKRRFDAAMSERDTSVIIGMGSDRCWKFKLLINSSIGVDLSDTSIVSSTPINDVLGFEFSKPIGDNLSIGGSGILSNSSYPIFIQNQILQTSVIPGLGYARSNGNFYTSHNWSAYLSYSPNNIFNFQLGKGKNFFGNGHRSMLLSDNGPNYPYLKITTDVWKVKYVNLFSAMRDITFSGGDISKFENKYSAIHYLSWNVSKNLNISLFESITWGEKDTLNRRGYEINYLNPIIFYRPVEFSIGSPDNAIIGTNISYIINPKNEIYGQLALDEFLLDSLRSGNGWWANKFGIQLGCKKYDLFKVKNLNAQLEFNTVRPFMYSHVRNLENYGHYNEPLAHSFGANFYESQFFIRYQKNKFQFQNQLMYAVRGLDSSAVSYGGNIFLPYTLRDRENGHKIGQGDRRNIVYNHISASWLLNEKFDLRAQINYIFRNEKGSTYSHNTNFISIGIKTTLPNQYLDR